MSCLIFLGGMFTGIAITRLFYQETSGHGYFTVMPYSDDEISIDEGFYSVRVSLPKDVKNLVNKDMIILHNSHK